MIILPNNLSSVAKCAAKESYRYALCGIQVSERDNGTYRIEATDGRKLIRVEGQNACDPSLYANVAKVTGAPNGATQAILDPSYFLAAQKAAKTTELTPAS